MNILCQPVQIGVVCSTFAAVSCSPEHTPRVRSVFEQVLEAIHQPVADMAALDLP